MAPWPDFNAIPTDEYANQREALLRAYQAIRAYSRDLTSRFNEAEQQIQSMPDASPTKWHLGHTTWFFETFLLEPFQAGFDWVDERYRYLFNSYYNAIGSQYPRPRRGLITNPDLADVWAYRSQVDQEMERLLADCDDGEFESLAPVLVLGLNHEQQHQELILTDIKHALFQSAGEPEISGSRKHRPSSEGPDWIDFPGGLVEVGYPDEGFCFDNELARHKVWLQPFRLSNTLVSAGEWLQFMEDGGYTDPLLWLSDGWQWRRENDIQAPLYWRRVDERWHRFTIHSTGAADSRFAASGMAGRAANSDHDASPGAVGASRTAARGFRDDVSRRDCGIDWKPIEPQEPICHISYYEADAFATWRSARLPREAEWEACTDQANDSTFADLGSCWEWTQSAYLPYPGFRPTEGMAGEYNGKFMINQMVLRGSSPATPAFHSRPSYRNFFYPHARWQYTGLRLAGDF